MIIKNIKFAVLLFILIFPFYMVLPAHADDAQAKATPIPASEEEDKIDYDTNQKILELKKKIDELTKQAEEYHGTVLEKQQEGESLKKQIGLLNTQILSLQSQIGATEHGITATKLEITSRENKLFDTQQNIERQKAAIKESMQYLYHQDRLTPLTTLLKNPNLSDFANDAQQTSNLHEKLAEMVVSLKKDKVKLENEKSNLVLKKSDLEALNQKQILQKASLSGNKSTKNKLLVDTKGQESQYQKLLTETEKQKAAFFAEMQGLENAAITNGTVITHVTATAVPARGTKIFVNPYDDKIYQSQGYGRTAYAIRGAYGAGGIHNGIDIVSGCGSLIHPIGSGKVLASGYNSGFGNWVAIQHDAGGGMVSIYGHMQAPTLVRIGMKVDHGTTLGFEGSTGSSTGCHLHLSIYKDFFTYINSKTKQLIFNYANGSLNPLDYIKL